MLDTKITRALGLETPIVNAGMAMIARPPLAAAVSNAGGLGTIGCDIETPDSLRRMIRQVRSLTDKPFGVDMISDFLTEEHVDVLAEEKVPVVIFFWSPPAKDYVERLHAAGAAVWMQVGGVVEARQGVALGVDALIVQGAESGGHNRSEASTMTLFPRIRRLFPELPLLVAGGIVEGTTMAAALVLGADAVWCGSRFLASTESVAHGDYKARAVQADVGETEITKIYGPEWPDQAVRAIVNEGLREAIEGDRSILPEQTESPIGETVLDGKTVPVPRYSAILPTVDFRGDIEQTCLTAGQSAGNIERVLPAAEIVRTMTAEAEAVLGSFGNSVKAA